MPPAKANYRIVTDETLMESIRHGDNAYPFQYYYENIWDYDFHCVDWHWHPELELVYVQSGQAICFAGEERLALEAGSGLLVNSRALHRFEAEGDTIVPNAVFSPFLIAPEESLLCRKYILPFLNSGIPCQVFDPAVPWQAQCIRLMLEVFALQDGKEPDEMHTVERLMAFWREMYRHLTLEGRQQNGATGTNQARLQIMMRFIQEHYREDLRLEDIASSVFIGRSTALQLFRQYIRLSPVAYLIQYRLKQAAGLLSSTEKKVSAVSEETGFQSAGYFCRKFRELYGVSPQEYRKAKSRSE